MVNINKSLLILGNVIHSLGQNNSNTNSTNNKNNKNKKVFAPYKDSKLTQILEDSLGGNSATYLIANISPCDENFEETISTLKFADRAHSIMTKVSLNQLNDKDEGYKSKEFNKICDELFQLKQLLNIRKKRGTLEPIQEELLKLKDENTQLKKYLGGGNNVNRIQELIVENNNLRKEIKVLTEMNKNLKNEINSKPISHLSSELNSDVYKNNLSEKKKTNIKSNNLTNNNNYSSKKNLNDNNNNNNIYNYINNKSNNQKNNNENNKKNDELFTIDDYLATNNKNNNNKNNNQNKYDIDDILEYNDNNHEENGNLNNDNINSNNLNKNNNKNQKSSKNVFLESGQNIIYGSKNYESKNDKDNKNNVEGDEEYDDEFKDLNYEDLDYDINENDNNYSKNKSKANNSKSTNLKLSKLNNATTPYERLQILDQLELENKKKTQELIDNLTKNQNDN
jgi:hypothetical protein